MTNPALEKALSAADSLTLPLMLVLFLLFMAKARPEEAAEGAGEPSAGHSESRLNALQTQKWNLNPSWKMRWGNPPVAINFLFEMVRMFVPVRIGLPAASTVTTWLTPETLTMLKRLVNSPMTSTRIDSRTGMKRE